MYIYIIALMILIILLGKQKYAKETGDKSLKGFIDAIKEAYNQKKF